MAGRRTLEARAAGLQFEDPRHSRVEPLTVRSVIRERGSELHCVEADEPSSVALRVMADRDIGAVLVLADGRVSGIFSERDHVRNSLRVGPLAATTPLREAMTRCDVFASALDSAQSCLNLMKEQGLRHLPVHDAGNVIAMVSLDDLLGEMVAHHQRVFRANELDQQILFLRGTYSC